MSQPNPTPNDRPAIADLVIADIQARKAKGIETYGTPLQAFNGRNALQDLYEELLDAAKYVKQKIIEAKEEAKEEKSQTNLLIGDRVDFGLGDDDFKTYCLRDIDVRQGTITLGEWYSPDLVLPIAALKLLKKVPKS